MIRKIRWALFSFDRENKKDDNPLHQEYGIVSNVLYIVKKIRQYDAPVLFFLFFGAFTGSLLQYMWSFFGKFVIDMVQLQAAGPDRDWLPLLKLIAVITLIELSCMVTDGLINNRMWYRLIFIRSNMISERIAKALSMPYEMLEQPKILDMNAKAQQATGGDNIGLQGLMWCVNRFCRQFLLMLVTFSTIFLLDWRMLLLLALMSFLQYLFFVHTVRRDRSEVWEKLAPTWRKLEYMTEMTQDFGYAKDIRLFHMKDFLGKKQHEVCLEKQEKMLHSKNLWIQNSAVANGFVLLSNAVVYAVLISCVIDRGLSIGDFTLYLGLSAAFMSALNEFFSSIAEFQKCSLATDDFRSFMDLQTEEGDFLPLPEMDRYTFTFQNVSYRYEGASGDALKHVNLTLEAGTKLAIVGLNGAGKTTFIKLLLRLYDPTEGEILLNGTDIRRFRREEYYRLFSPVFQNVELFAFSVAENVSMAPLDRTDKALAQTSLQKAGLGEKTVSLPNGIDTQLLKVLADDGVDFSGGERQKLALARALYKNAPVIVLDEPTAALDAIAEYELYRNFNEIIGEKSAVYISHRLSSTRFCDEIAMFREGEIIEYGSHDALLQNNGAYAEMFAIQAQYYQDEEVPVYV